MKKEEIKEFLAEQICTSMYMDKSELEDDALFSDFGLESITLVKILTKINDKYSCHLNIEEFLLHQTLNEASGFIYQTLTIKSEQI